MCMVCICGPIRGRQAQAHVLHPLSETKSGGSGGSGVAEFLTTVSSRTIT